MLFNINSEKVEQLKKSTANKEILDRIDQQELLCELTNLEKSSDLLRKKMLQQAIVNKKAEECDNPFNVIFSLPIKKQSDAGEISLDKIEQDLKIFSRKIKTAEGELEKEVIETYRPTLQYTAGFLSKVLVMIPKDNLEQQTSAKDLHKAMKFLYRIILTKTKVDPSTTEQEDRLTLEQVTETLNNIAITETVNSNGARGYLFQLKKEKTFDEKNQAYLEKNTAESELIITLRQIKGIELERSLIQSPDSLTSEEYVEQVKQSIRNLQVSNLEANLNHAKIKKDNIEISDARYDLASFNKNSSNINKMSVPELRVTHLKILLPRYMKKIINYDENAIYSNLAADGSLARKRDVNSALDEKLKDMSSGRHK
ncbi:MAG: hypothetical protein RSB99_00625 [Bacilli bacterium]